METEGGDERNRGTEGQSLVGRGQRVRGRRLPGWRRLALRALELAGHTFITGGGRAFGSHL